MLLNEIKRYKLEVQNFSLNRESPTELSYCVVRLYVLQLSYLVIIPQSNEDSGDVLINSHLQTSSISVQTSASLFNHGKEILTRQ